MASSSLFWRSFGDWWSVAPAKQNPAIQRKIPSFKQLTEFPHEITVMSNTIKVGWFPDPDWCVFHAHKALAFRDSLERSSVSRPAHHAWGDADCLWNYRKVGVEMWNWCGSRGRATKRHESKCAKMQLFFTSVMWCHQPTPWHCNQQLIWKNHIIKHPLFHLPSLVMDLLLRRIFECCLFLRWDAIIHSIAQDVAKKTSPLMGVSFRSFKPKRGAKSRFFFWINERLKKAGGHVYTQERQAARRRRRRTETEETGHFYFFETFFVTSKHELLTCFGHLRCCKLRKVPLPYLGFNVVFFFQRNFPDERRHTWSDTFFSWMEYIVGISQAEVFFFFVCVFCLLATLRTQLGMLGWCKTCWSSWKCLSLLGSNTSNDFESLLWHFPTNYQFLVFMYAAHQYLFSTRPGSLMRRVSWFAKGELIQSLRQRKQFSRSCH